MAISHSNNLLEFTAGSAFSATKEVFFVLYSCFVYRASVLRGDKLKFLSFLGVSNRIAYENLKSTPMYAQPK